MNPIPQIILQNFHLILMPSYDGRAMELLFIFVMLTKVLAKGFLEP